jgi:MoaA/NifB/PqqE/SkfB family radical SAM enzyme
MIVTPFNVNELYDTIQLAKKLGASSFKVSTVVPVGRACINDLHFSPNNIKLLSDEISRAKDTFGDFIFETPEFLLKSNEYSNNCGAGTKSITLKP